MKRSKLTVTTRKSNGSTVNLRSCLVPSQCLPRCHPSGWDNHQEWLVSDWQARVFDTRWCKAYSRSILGKICLLAEFP